MCNGGHGLSFVIVDDHFTPIYVVPDDKRLSLDLTKNIIVHFFVPRALVATAVAAGSTTAATGVRVQISNEMTHQYIEGYVWFVSPPPEWSCRLIGGVTRNACR